MHVKQLFIAVAFASIAGTMAVAATGPAVTTPATTKWVAGTGLEKGTFYSVLAGDPTKSGMYIERLKLPAGTVLGPHMHGAVENVTVISGTLWVGLGKTMDKTKLMPLEAGAFASVPANYPHSAMTKTDTVIQIEGMGPESMTVVK